MVEDASNVAGTAGSLMLWNLYDIWYDQVDIELQNLFAKFGKLGLLLGSQSRTLHLPFIDSFLSLG